MPNDTDARERGAHRGLTNGCMKDNGIKNGIAHLSGMTNGLENPRINQAFKREGLTNGLGNPSPGSSSAFLMARTHSNGAVSGPKLGLAFGVVMLALIISLSVLNGMGIIGKPPVPAIAIDGQFRDWDDIETVTFSEMASINSPLAVASAAMTVSEGRLFLMLRTAGPILQGGAPNNRTMDSTYAFLDLDANSNTGYAVKGMGADALAVIEGWNGTPHTRNFYLFDQDANKNDWHGFRLAGGIAAASSEDQLEVEIPWSSVGGEKPGIKVLWSVVGYTGHQEWAPVPLTFTKPVVFVVQTSLVAEDILTPDGDADILSLSLVANKDCTIIGLEFSSSITLKESGGSISLPVQLKAGTERSLTVSAHVPDSGAATFNLSLMQLSLSPDGDFSMLGKNATAYVGSAPERIVIDGAFGDWNLIEKHDDSTGGTETPSLDITRTASVGWDGGTFFFVEVAGDLLGGMATPEKNDVTPIATSGGGNSTANESITPVLSMPPLYGEDALRIFVDADNDPSTGYAVADSALVETSPGVMVSGIPGSTIGADYMVNVTGKNGMIWTKEVLKFNGANSRDWRWTSFSSANAAYDDKRIEIGIDHLNLTGKPLLVQAKGWGGEDMAALSVDGAFGNKTRSGLCTRSLLDAAPLRPLFLPPTPSPSAKYIVGDWIVSDTNVTQDEEIILGGNLIVTSTGSLTLNNVTLRIDQGSDGQYTINVASGGQFYVNQGSNITSNNSYYYLFVVYGKLRVNNTDLSMMDILAGSWGGIHVYSNDIYVGNSTIFNCPGAGMTIEGTSATVYNTTFHDCYRGILLETGATLTTERCTFHNLTDTGIDASDNCVVRVSETGFNDIKYYGVFAYWYTTAIIANCTFVNITERPVYDLAYSTIWLNDSSIQNYNKWWGVYVRSSSTAYIRNLTATGCDRAVDVSLNSGLTLNNSDISGNVLIGVYLTQSSADITNCTIEANGVGVYSSYNSNIILLNSTVQNSIGSDLTVTYGGWIFIKWFLHVQVLNNTNVPIPNANVRVYNVFSNLVFDGYTGPDGWIRWIIVTNRTLNHSNAPTDPTTIIYYTPHTITAEYNLVTNGTTETMNVSKEVLIRLDYSPTVPLPPTNLALSLAGDDVVLNWTNSTSTDLAYYRIYKTDTPGSFDFATPYHNTSGDANPRPETWTDIDAANDWVRDYYIVRAVNFAHEEETNTNQVGNNDWVVEVVQTHSDMDVVLYGNLTVTLTGSLTLNNVTLRINQVANGQDTIMVDNGGSLYIDRGSNITSNNTYYFMFYTYGKLRIESSSLSRMYVKAGGYWGGIHVFSNDTYVGNSTISDNLGAGMTLRTISMRVYNTTFSDSFRGIWAWYNCDFVVERCTFLRINEAGLKLLYDGTLYVGNSTFRDGRDGIQANDDYIITVFNSTFIDNTAGFGIYANARSNVRVLDCYIDNCDDWGILLDSQTYGTVQNTKIVNCTTGIEIYDNSNATITNCTIEGNGGGVDANAYSNVTVLNSTVKNNLGDFVVGGYSWIFIKWFLHVRVLNQTDVPIPNANIKVYDVFNSLVFDGYTGSDGWLRWIIVVEKTMNKSGVATEPVTTVYYTPYNITASYSTANNYTEETMNISKEVIIKLDVDVIPEFPNIVIPLIGLAVISILVFRKRRGAGGECHFS